MVVDTKGLNVVKELDRGEWRREAKDVDVAIVVRTVRKHRNAS